MPAIPSPDLSHASQTAWADHLGVRRAFRRRGYPLARLSVDSHSLTHAPRLYEKAGFRTALGYHIFRL